MQNDANKLQRFLFDNLPIRGERIKLTTAWQEVLERREYPEVVQKYLGELVATAALLSATIKIEGKMTLQIEATGALNMLVVQITHDGGFRATATYQDNLPENATFKELTEGGRVVITIENAHSIESSYQGVIPLIDDSISEAIERYFETSEQLKTSLFLRNTETTLGGLLLQRIPGEMEDEDAYNRVCHLAGTVTAEELNDLDTQTLLYRLYSEDDIRLFEEESLHFQCKCSRDRSIGMLKQLSMDELKEIVAEESKVSVTCEFCGKSYDFAENDLNEIENA